jgi:outer membrane immunogenic protein
MWKTAFAAAAMLAAILPSSIANAGQKGDFWRDAPAYNWAGRYAGAALGYAWGESSQSYDRAGDHGMATLEPDGMSSSVYGGYNWMMTGNLLLGLEGELGVLGVSQGATTVFDGHVWSTEFGPFMATMRGRAGYAFGDWLVYGTGGLALATIEDVSIGNTPGETARKDGLRAGWVVGGGAEYAVSDQWSVRAEFLHMDFGREEGASANNEQFYFENTLNVFRVGASYAF